MERTPLVHVNTNGNYLTITLNIPWSSIIDPRRPSSPLGPDGMVRSAPAPLPRSNINNLIKLVLKTYRELKDIRATASKLNTKCETVRNIVKNHESERKHAKRDKAKAKALTLLSSGTSVTEVAKIVGVHRETIRRWSDEHKSIDSDAMDD